MRIALVNPPNTHAGGYEEENAAPPLGLCYIAAVLRQAGFTTDLFDFADASAEDLPLLERVGFFDYDLYGFTAYTKSFLAAVNLLHTLRRRASRAIVVFGGPHAGPCAEEVLQQYPEIDLVIRNEGEVPMLELARALAAHAPAGSHAADLSRVPSLVFRRRQPGHLPSGDPLVEREIVTNPPPASLPELDDLPLPSRDFRLEPVRLAYEHQRRPTPVEVAYISSSRGCPKRCSFCSIVVMSPKYRFRSVPSLMAEIKALHAQRPFGHVSFLDANFFVHVRRTLEFSRSLHAWDPQLTWSGTATADTIVKHAEVLPEIGARNCSFLEVGIESGNAASLARFNKWTTVEQNREAIRLLKQAGIGLALDFIMFEPEMTLHDLRQNLDFLNQTELSGYSPPECLYNAMRLYPATPARVHYVEMLALQPHHLMALTVPCLDSRVAAVQHLMNEYHRHFQQRITQAIVQLQRKWRQLVSAPALADPQAAQQLIAAIIRLQHEPYRFFAAAVAAAESGQLDRPLPGPESAAALGRVQTESVLAAAADRLTAGPRSRPDPAGEGRPTQGAEGGRPMSQEALSPGTRFVADPELLVVEEHQSIYLIPQRAAPLRLNHSATSTWKWLLTGEPLRQVIERYQVQYACSADEARADVGSLVDSLMTAGILSARPEGQHD